MWDLGFGYRMRGTVPFKLTGSEWELRKSIPLVVPQLTFAFHIFIPFIASLYIVVRQLT